MCYHQVVVTLFYRTGLVAVPCPKFCPLFLKPEFNIFSTCLYQNSYSTIFCSFPVISFEKKVLDFN
jgi:hypothetical protein